MTPQETIQEIKSKVYRNTDDCEMTISKDCYKTILNALEKQTLKKVEHSEWYPNDKDCPHCSSNLTSYEKSVKHCPWCGQALDWSDEE